MVLKKFFILLLFIGNEWITAPILMKFLEDYCYAFVNNLNIFNVNAKFLFNSVSIYIMPMVNPDGVDLATNNLNMYSVAYSKVLNISKQFPDIPFPSRMEG